MNFSPGDVLAPQLIGPLMRDRKVSVLNPNSKVYFTLNMDDAKVNVCAVYGSVIGWIIIIILFRILTYSRPAWMCGLGESGAI